MYAMARDGRALSHEALEELRLRAADLFAADVPVVRIAAGMGMKRSTVFAWKKAWKAGGAQALAAKPVPGRPGTLSDEQSAELKVLLTGHTPADYGFDAALWTRALIADLVEQRFGVRFTDTWVGTLMRRLGFSPQRPVYKATQQDPEKIQQWRTVVYPAIRAQAAQVGASIYFGDEAHLRSDFHAGTTWAPVGQTPVITASGKREAVNMISAITPRGRIHFTVHEGRCDALVFIEFCRALLRDDRGRVFLILDNSSIHRAKILKEYVASTNGRLTLFYLPPYSPQLNPDEWVWKNVKADRVGRRAGREPGQLFDMACNALDRLRKSPRIVRGFFGDPQLAYISQV
jgi:transposase